MSLSKRPHRETKFLESVCLTTSGVAIGWLTGLSTSPTLHIVVTGILTAVVAAASAIAGLQPQGHDRTETASGEESPAISIPVGRVAPAVATLVPLTLLLVGIVLGSPLGVYARSHDWLAAEPRTFIARWRPTRLPDDEIAKRLFDQLYPPGPRSTDSKAADKGTRANEEMTGSGTSSRLTGGLFSALSADECKKLLSASDTDLVPLMRGSADARIRKLADRCGNTACIRAALESFPCGEQQH